MLLYTNDLSVIISYAAVTFLIDCYTHNEGIAHRVELTCKEKLNLYMYRLQIVDVVY